MTDLRKFKVLLYSDDSKQTLYAAAYAATLLQHMSNIHLTIVQIQEINEGIFGTEFSWKELRPKYKRYYWGCNQGSEPSWIDHWPVSPKTERLYNESNEADYQPKNRQDEIQDEVMRKTQGVFLKNGKNVRYQVLCSNTCISDTADTADLILDYAARNSFGLIIMGEQEPSILGRLNFRSLPHSVRSKSSIPVVLVKKLPRDFEDYYLLNKTKSHLVSNGVTSLMNGRAANVVF